MRENKRKNARGENNKMEEDMKGERMCEALGVKGRGEKLKKEWEKEHRKKQRMKNCMKNMREGE